ncbi:MBL fold metallo-hydrolase [Pseudomaricurvus alkylphenolicus]|uniref:MBL fold metallo-hydrolase n=1 Tax=Pseudomaricurvus alkylphenolicus TaxID=1306991 RepID=UPI0014240375|nr:MBL fold metallo-hydrolase [Pseudomaricurvus alkylphenolicus]NIB40692.1 MBL fold metallo-hydrolase [Pseudomaricurvus alkylphenolicus]
MTIKIADKWFEIRKLGDGITHIWEPHVHPLVRCNIWHVRGSERDMLVDTGLGIASLKEAAREIFDKPLDVVTTHTHYDHIGGHCEFDNCTVHEAEAGELSSPDVEASLEGDAVKEFLDSIGQTGYEIEGDLISQLPYEGYDLKQYRVSPTKPTRIVKDGDTVDLGNRQFKIVHLPGHSPGSIGLWEASTKILFSGDAIYDGPLVDKLPGSNVEEYVETMYKLRELPVSVVHAGHEPSFGRERLVEICNAYINGKKA